jgi:phosphate transport system ATP-binding protein
MVTASKAPDILVDELRVHRGKTRILDIDELTFPGGTISVLLGPPGAGKTLLFFCLDRLVEEMEGLKVTGRIRLGDEDISSIEPVTELRRRIAYVPPQAPAFPGTVLQNLCYGLAAQGLSGEEDQRRRIQETLAPVGLWEIFQEWREREATRLGPPDQGLVAIARALVLSPSVLLLDEPVLGMDHSGGRRIEELVRNLEGRMTVLWATRNARQAARVGKYAVFVKSGRVVESGSVSGLFTAPMRRETEDYLLGRNP